MAYRLSTVAIDLVNKLEDLQPTELKRVAAEVADLAVARTGLADPRLDGPLAAVRDGVAGSSAMRQLVDQLTEALDEHAWDLQDQADAGAIPYSEYLAAFRKARAAASVGYALEAGTLQGAMECLYEGQAAIEDLGAVRMAVGIGIAAAS